MSTLLEAQNSINAIRGEVGKCLNRCMDAPYPDAERRDKVNQLRNEATVIADRASAELSRIDAPAREPLAKLQQEIGQRQQEQQELQQKQSDAQNIHRARQQEYQAKVAQLNGPTHASDRTELESQWQAAVRDFQSASAELNRRSAEAQARLNELYAQQQKEQQRSNDDLARIRNGAATDVMLQAEQEMKSLLDRAGALEKEIATGASVELSESVTADFESKADDFSNAEVHHKSQARKLFWAMIGVIAIAAAAVYVLFIRLAAVAANVERIVALATGRIAILVFLGLALKYLADLHRAHSEQAIIYCDRKAALSVAQVLLASTPELEQKRAVLKTIADIYLNFENSAFVARRPKPSEPGADVDAQIKRMKDVVEGIKPILDAIGKAADKGKP
jgi:hypothetical protein